MTRPSQNLRRQLVLLQQVAKAQDGAFVGQAGEAGIQVCELAVQRDVVQRLFHRGDDLGVLVADVHVDELAGEVQPAFARMVPQRDALASGHAEHGQVRLRRP